MGVIMKLTRREFLEKSAAAVALLSTVVCSSSKKMVQGMPYRTLGKTGLDISLLSLGGWDMGIEKLSEKDSIHLMRSAIDNGINFFDNAWEYHDGLSEERMGKALMDGYRQKVILMTKHHGREPKRAQQHLEDSLRRFKTDVIDVWQFHELDEMQEVEDIYSSGVLDFALKAREEGKIRFIGFTGHYSPALHLDMINRGFEWDTVQMPVNVLDHHFQSFTNKVLPVAKEKNIGVLAMKSLAGPPGVILENDIATVEECLRFAMTMPVSTVISGMDTLDILKENVQIARNFKPLTKEELSGLLKGTEESGREGKFEEYKTYTPEPDDNW